MRVIALKITAIVVSVIITLSFLAGAVYSNPKKLACETVFKELNRSGSVSQMTDSAPSLAPLQLGETRFSADGVYDALLKQEKNRVDVAFSILFTSIVFAVLIISFMSRIHKSAFKKFRLLI